MRSAMRRCDLRYRKSRKTRQLRCSLRIDADCLRSSASHRRVVRARIPLPPLCTTSAEAERRRSSARTAGEVITRTTCTARATIASARTRLRKRRTSVATAHRQRRRRWYDCTQRAARRSARKRRRGDRRRCDFWRSVTRALTSACFASSRGKILLRSSTIAVPSAASRASPSMLMPPACNTMAVRSRRLSGTSQIASKFFDPCLAIVGLFDLGRTEAKKDVRERGRPLSALRATGMRPYWSNGPKRETN
mmetsp:Transcript_40832/g.101485  ORF Transcript_40832/g.101485 Transcript_40832/m.101485 type:complete len:250 (-) Transcript_40832:80-829(-)